MSFAGCPRDRAARFSGVTVMKAEQHSSKPHDRASEFGCWPGSPQGKTMSPKLEATPRTKPQAVADMIAARPSYVVICRSKDGLYIAEQELGTSLGAIVYDLATGQFHNPVAVLFVSLGEKAVDVSEDVARAMVVWMRDKDMLRDEEGNIKPNDFLDYAWSDWRANIYCVGEAA